MAVLLLDHLPGCSPVYKCASCVIEAHFRKILKPERFDELVMRIAAFADREVAKPQRPDLSEIELLPELQRFIKHVAGIHLPLQRILRDTMKLPVTTPLSELPELSRRAQSKLFQHNVKSINDALSLGKSGLARLYGVKSRTIAALETTLLLVGYILPD